MLAKIKSYISKIIGTVTAVVTLGVSLTVPFGNASAEGYSNDELKSMANQIAILVNEARVEAGLKPVYIIPYLNDMAQVRSREAIFTFSHTRADGTKFFSIIDTNLIDYSFIAEDLAAGSDNAADTFQQWRESEKHWEMIMKPDITHIGVGCAYERNSDYEFYWQLTMIESRKEYGGQYLPTEYEIVPKGDGDVNGDANINSFDYITLVDYLTKKRDDYPCYLNDAQMEAADCFKDGLLTEADAKVMMRYILGEYKELPFVF